MQMPSCKEYLWDKDLFRNLTPRKPLSIPGKKERLINPKRMASAIPIFF
jgi:hypothetical protein